MDSGPTNETLVTQPSAGTPLAQPLGRGESLGRYVVLDRLGSGGMGVVYAAYDPELDRKLAIKLVHPSKDGSADQTEGRTRIMREAQALAKLQHPNVVAIHDVGEHEGQVFIAMEFIQGVTLSKWVDEQDRSWQEVIRVLQLAGQGLAAAHEKNIIHRDFKPDNVMIAEDGRVRVLDFGLAAARAESTESRLVESSDATGDLLSTELTRAGARLGTPAYMSPEQHLGATVEASSDQFSFCVTLWRSLYGDRPFAGDSPAAIAFNVIEGKLREPESTARVPRWIRGILLRGLKRKPSERWPSMQALLDELDRDPSRQRRRLFAVGTLLALGAGLFGANRLDHARRVDACALESSAINEIWSDQTRATLREQLAKSGSVHARHTADKTLEWLDRYANDWKQAQLDSCTRSTVANTRSPHLHGLTTSCLSDRRESLGALLGTLMDSEDPLAKAVPAAAALPLIDQCLDERHLTQRIPPPENPELLTRVEAARGVLRESVALATLARHAEALSLATDVAGEAEQLEWAPLVAEARFRVGKQLDSVGKYEQAERALRTAYLAASRAGDDEMAADSAAMLGYVLSQRLQRPDEGSMWIDIAEASLERVGLNRGLHRASLLMERGATEAAAGDDEAAVAAYSEVVAIRRELLGDEHPAVGQTLANLGITTAGTGKWKEAKGLLVEALASSENSLGNEHPDLAGILWTLARAHQQLGEKELANQRAQRALDIVEAAYPANHPDIGKALLNLANTVEDDAARLPLIERALPIMQESMGPDHVWVAQIKNNLGLIHLRNERPQLALRLLEEALEAQRAAMGPEHHAVGLSLRNTALAASENGEHDKAIERAREALEVRTKARGPEHPDVADSHAMLGRVLIDAGRAEQAIPALERAMALTEKAEASPSQVAACRFELARALMASKQDPERARELARLALPPLEANDPDEAKRVTAWLERHGS